MTFPGHVEVALGADRTNNSFAMTWTDITADVAQDTATIGGGRPSEAVLPDPGSFTVTLNNGDGRYTPRLATSPYYGTWGRGTPLRHSVNAGTPHLLLTGATNCRAGTPDAASLDITGDIYIAVEVPGPVSTPPPGVTYEITGKFNPTGNQRSWVLFLSDDGILRLRWSTDGTALGQHDAGSTVPLQRPSAGPYSFAAKLDVNGTAGDYIVTFYGTRGSLADLRTAIAGGDPYAQLGDPVTGVGITSIFASTATLDIGDVTGSGFSPYAGQIRAAEVRSGDHTGTVVANPNFTAQAVGAGSFADTAAVPKTWTITSPAAITDRQVTFVGEITAIQPRWPGHGVPGTGQVTVTASGVLRRLRQGEQPLQSALYRRVTDARNLFDLVAYWPLEDGSDATAGFSPIDGVVPFAKAGDFSFGASSAIVASKPLPQISADQLGAWTATVPSASAPTTDWAVEMFLDIPTPETDPTRTRLMLIHTTGSPVQTWSVNVSDANFQVTGLDSTGAATVDVTNAIDPAFFEQPTYIRWDFSQVGGNVAWAFSYVPLNGSGVAFGTSGTTAGTLGRVKNIQNVVTGPPDGMTIGHLIVQNGLALGWLAQAEIAFTGETATARIYRLGQEQDVAIAIHGDLTAGEPMGPQRPLTFTALLEECATADIGILSEQRTQLGLHYRNHNSLYNQAAQIELDSALVMPFEPDEDDQGLSNDVTATRDGGSKATATDQPSVDKDGLYHDDVTVNVNSDDQLPSQAGWRVHLGTWPEMRFRALAAEIAKDPALLDDWLAVAIGDRVTVTDPPADYPTETVDQLMTGYTQTLGALTWDLVLNGLPAGPWTVGVIDTDSTPDTDLDRLDTDGSTLQAGINTSATSLSVGIGAGPLWTTDAAEFPMDIEIGGEVMTLSAISGSSSPQTFTVSARHVNGVVKSHSSGEAVALAHPFRLAL